MKNIYIVFLFTFFAHICLAGGKPPLTTPKDDAFLQMITKKNNLIKSSANKTNSTVDRMIGKRHDTYVTISASWANSDSANYYYQVAPSGVGDTMELYYVYDGPSSTWYPSSRTLFTINANNQVTQSAEQTWLRSSSTWRNSTRYILNYASATTYSDYTTQVWDTLTNAWLNQIKYTYTYDGNGNNLSTLVQGWDTTSNNWLNSEKVTLTYNATNKPMTDIIQYWDPMSSVWYNIQRINYSYDSNLDQIEQLYERWDNVGVTWTNDNKHVFTYASHAVLTDLYQTWLAGTSSWRNSTKLNNTYTGINKTLELKQDWDTVGNAWLNNSKNAYSFNAANKLTLEIDSVGIMFGTGFAPSRKTVMVWDANNNNTNRESFYWDGMALAFVSLGRTTFQFDANNNNTYRLDENFSTTSSSYVLTDQTFYYYQTFSYSSIEEAASISKLGIFPNPANGNCGVHVSFTLQNAAQVTINMYGSDGKLLTTETNQYAAGDNFASMRIANLPAGIYYVQFVNDSNHETSTLKLSVQ